MDGASSTSISKWRCLRVKEFFLAEVRNINVNHKTVNYKNIVSKRIICGY